MALTALGCGTYTAYLYTIGLQTLVGELACSQITWNRGYGTQTGQIVIPTPGRAECAPVIGTLDQWSHEIVIIRTPGGRVASGPVTAYEISDDQATITFSDLSAWYGKRKIHHTHRYTNTDIALIFADYHDDAINLDNPMGFGVRAAPVNILLSQTTLGGQHFIASDQLDQLSQAGCDWYVRDRTTYAGGAAVGIATVATLTDDHFQTPPKITSGDGAANLIGVRGAGAGQGKDPIYEQAEDTSDQQIHGLLEAVDTVDTIRFPNEARVAAAQRIALLSPPPLLISGGVLTPDAPLQIDQLYPGQLYHVALKETVKHVIGTYRLSTINGNVQNGDEKITIETQPVGSISYRLTHPPSKAFEAVFAKMLKRMRRFETGGSLYGEVSLSDVVHFGPATLRAVLDPDTGEITILFENAITGGESSIVGVIP